MIGLFGLFDNPIVEWLDWSIILFKDRDKTFDELWWSADWILHNDPTHWLRAWRSSERAGVAEVLSFPWKKI